MKRFFPLAIIFLLALFLRIYNLANQPPGMTWDEAALGYDAYSILKTGRDQHGAFMPIIFKSFGDYKPGVYVYLTVPAVALLGLNETAVRMPSAIFGALAVIGIYLLTNLLFGSEAKPRPTGPMSFITSGHIAALVLALMPWHLHFSRGGWEVNTFVTMVLFGTYLFIRSLKNEKISPLWAALLFALSIFTYQAGKLLTPIIFTTCVLVYWGDVKTRLSQVLKNEKPLFPVYLLLLGIVLVYFYISVIGPAGNRVTRLSIFLYRPTPSQELIKTDNNNMLSVGFFHSQADLTLRAIASRYLYHFSPELLFFENSTPREALPKMGMLYLFDAVWIVFGLIFLIRSKDWRSKVILLVFLVSAPIGASLTLSEFSVVRALFLTVPLAILISLGIYQLVKNHRYIFAVLLILYLHNVALGLDLYFKHSQRFLAPGFNYGHKQAVAWIIDNPAKRVVMTDVYGQPYIYYLFYTGYDPATFQKENKFVSGGVDVGFVPSVANLEFHQFSIDDIRTQKDALFIGTIGNIKDDFDYNLPQVENYDQVEIPDSTDVVFRMVKTYP